MAAPLDRRSVLRTGALAAAAGGLAACDSSSGTETPATPAPTSGSPTPPVTSAAAISRLSDGNRRWASGDTTRAAQDAAAPVSASETPYAVILACTDARVPPEVVFDEGLGHLAVVRTPAHVADASALGAIEFATQHLGSRAVFVLGHNDCDIIATAVQTFAHAGGTAPGHMQDVVNQLRPAYDIVKSHADATADMVAAHVAHTVDVVR
ncbi:MAG TPA: carbonic anhydrase, partial [Micromonosporaceae bacterium]